MTLKNAKGTTVYTRQNVQNACAYSKMLQLDLLMGAGPSTSAKAPVAGFLPGKSQWQGIFPGTDLLAALWEGPNHREVAMDHFSTILLDHFFPIGFFSSFF